PRLLALVFLFIFITALVALSGPGRIDILDGYTRYEVGRSLVEHGDSVVRDRDVWFSVFPGRNGQRYTNYRFPQSALAAAAIMASDLTGPVAEARRHFFFSLSGGVLCGLAAVLYALWFSRTGLSQRAALLWAAGGVFCTPLWFYGTTTFDDVLGSLFTLAAVATGFGTRRRFLQFGAIASGLLLAIAFNCKPPLALFAAPALAAGWDGRRPTRARLLRAGAVVVGVLLGVAAYKAYDFYKFPPNAAAAKAEVMQKGYTLMWPGNFWAGFSGLLVSPGVGTLWYWPPVILACYGLAAWYRREQWFALTIGLSSAVFVCFIATMTFFAGDPNWGPRYLTPVFALLWLFVPAGAARLRRPSVALLLMLAFAGQVAALSVDPLRLYIERGLTSAFFLADPWAYFRPECSQLLARPRQVREIASYAGPAPLKFSPAARPTLPVTVDPDGDEPLEVQRYWVLNSLRPWWISQRHLAASEQPVDLDAALRLLLSVAGGSLVGLAVCIRRSIASPANRISRTRFSIHH
ncbi:MAG TPA: hypothetical protein VFW87_23095, partial [Pirellulales bacterium]|nr:hypothetical protein [Pirellulales bacterium]